MMRHALQERSGYQIIWLIAKEIGHPALCQNLAPLPEPVQKADTSFLTYRQMWERYLFTSFSAGVNYSDRYFVECFIENLHPMFNENLKPLLLHHLRDVPVDGPVPYFWWPEHLPGHIASSAQRVGFKKLTPMSTPRELSTRPSKNVSSKNLSSSKDTRHVRQILDTSSPCRDIRAVYDFDDESLMAICSLMAASHDQRRCFFCNKPGHVVNSCPDFEPICKDLTRAKRILLALQRSVESRGGLPPRNSSSRDDTPPRRTMRPLVTDDDTDDELTIAQLTDDDLSDTGGKQDFP